MTVKCSAHILIELISLIPLIPFPSPRRLKSNQSYTLPLYNRALTLQKMSHKIYYVKYEACDNICVNAGVVRLPS